MSNPYFGQLPISSSIGGKNTTAAQLLKPYPRFLNVATYRNNTGQTNYNAGQVKLEQRLSHGIYFLFAYTHSKLIDDASSVFSSTVLSSPNTSSLIAADTFTPRLERDSSNGDMPNVTSFAGIYNIPAGPGHRFASTGVADVLLGGWALNGILSLQSGMPVTVTQATNNNAFAGFVLQRPNIIANPALPAALRTPARFFNTAVAGDPTRPGAFATAPQFFLGNGSRNPVRGPAYRDLDMALVKHTHVTEKVDLELRAEMFDITNTPAFAQRARITATTTDPRVMQFALRLSR